MKVNSGLLNILQSTLFETDVLKFLFMDSQLI